MANPTEDPPSAQIVGNAFVHQYYLYLHSSPEKVHKFYEESSLLSRPERDGTMTSVTTIQGINDKILSFEYHNYHVQILTADSQYSFKDGVIVLVTGCLTGNDNVRRKFTQTFFLAPQDKGYVVLNDIFKYVDDETNIDVNISTVPLTLNHVITESSGVADQPVLSQTTSVEVDNTNGNEVNHVLENGEESVTEKSDVADNPVDSRQNVAVNVSPNVAPNIAPNAAVNVAPNVAPQVTEAAASTIQKDTPKKSFASVVNDMVENKAPFMVRTPPPKPVERPRAPATPEVLPSRNNTAVEKTNVPAVKAHAIFVANLPMDATDEELDKVFKQFGSIKSGGIQVRSNKHQGTCFGFVEFESASSLQSALKASPIPFGNRNLSIEERRANNDRGRFPSGRGGYRSDNFRGRENYTGGRENYSRENYSGGRGNYSGGRGYGRNDFEKRGDFSGQPRGNGGGNGETYQQRSYENGGKVARQTVKVAAV